MNNKLYRHYIYYSLSEYVLWIIFSFSPLKESAEFVPRSLIYTNKT